MTTLLRATVKVTTSPLPSGGWEEVRGGTSTLQGCVQDPARTIHGMSVANFQVQMGEALHKAQPVHSRALASTMAPPHFLGLLRHELTNPSPFIQFPHTKF